MVRRNPPQSKTDDHAFPIRVKFKHPAEHGIQWYGLRARLLAWIASELGPLRCVEHSAGWSQRRQATALYFRTLEDALRWKEAFPELELADGVACSTYRSPAVPFGDLEGR